MPRPAKFAPQFIFDERFGPTGRYLNATTKRLVSDKAIITQLNKVIAGTRGEMEQLALDLQANRINLQTFYNEMRVRMKVIHGVSGAIANGGVERMGLSDWGSVGGVSRKQYGFLNDFVKEIEAGLPLDGRFLNRVRMYFEAGRSTFHNMRTRIARRKGHTQARRILGPAERHCLNSDRPGCVELADLGWVAIEDLVSIGEATCLTRCHCTVEYREVVGEMVENRARVRRRLSLPALAQRLRPYFRMMKVE